MRQLFKKYKLTKKLTVSTVKQWIYNAHGKAIELTNRYHKKSISYFPESLDINELNDIIQVFTDAWNYFPHKVLDCKSPHEVMQAAIAKQPAEDDKA